MFKVLNCCKFASKSINCDYNVKNETLGRWWYLPTSHFPEIETADARAEKQFSLSLSLSPQFQSFAVFL